MKKGESECQYYIDKLEYLDERQRDTRIEQCRSLLCHGELRNKSGTVSKTYLLLCAKYNAHFTIFSLTNTNTHLSLTPTLGYNCPFREFCWLCDIWIIYIWIILISFFLSGRSCMCSCSPSCWFWLAPSPGMSATVSRFTDSQSQCRISCWRTSRTVTSEWVAPSEALSVTQTKVRLILKSEPLCQEWFFCQINLLILLFSTFLNSKEHFPCEITRPQSGAVSHAAGQRCLPQTAVVQLPPQRHRRLPASQWALHTLPIRKWLPLQAPPFLRLCHRPHGGSGRELSAADLSVCPQLAMPQHSPQPQHGIPFLFTDVISIIWALLTHVTQNQKGQEVSVFFREKKRDYGVNCCQRREWTLGCTCLYIKRHCGETWDLYLCVCVRIITTVFCYCPIRQLFNSSLLPCVTHIDAVFWRSALLPPVL